MMVREALSDGASILSGTSSETPFLDASLILAHVLGIPRDALLSKGPDALSEESRSEYQKLLDRRADGESVAYILGEKEFFGRSFIVDARVLVPRPDTEILVEAALDSIDRIAAHSVDPRGSGGIQGRKIKIHDAFTGSGCVGITLAAERSNTETSISDISRGALDVAEANARTILGRPLPSFCGDILEAVVGLFDIIVANPPYVTRSETDRIEAAGSRGNLAAREPRSALDGGPDGLVFYRRLVPEAEKRLAAGGFLAVEIGEDQGACVSELFRNGGFGEVEILPDLSGSDRVVRGRRA